MSRAPYPTHSVTTDKTIVPRHVTLRNATDGTPIAPASETTLALLQGYLTPYTPYSLIGANTSNATVVKASAGRVGALVGFNLAATPVYLKVYDKATTPDQNDTPKLRLMIPGNTAGAGFVYPVPPGGLTFLNGISFRLVTGVGDTDNTAVAANEQLINLGYL